MAPKDAAMSRARIAVDAMGGDHAPEEIVAGALLGAARVRCRDPAGRGRGARSPASARRRRPSAVRVIHAPEAVAMDLSPSTALRSCERTSLGVAVEPGQAG